MHPILVVRPVSSLSALASSRPAVPTSCQWDWAWRPFSSLITGIFFAIQGWRPIGADRALSSWYPMDNGR